MTVWKPKRNRRLKFRTGRKQVEPMTHEPKRTYLGTVTLTEGEALVLPADVDNADPKTIKLAIEQAERAKQEAAAQETQRLREMFFEADDR